MRQGERWAVKVMHPISETWLPILKADRYVSKEVAMLAVQFVWRPKLPWGWFTVTRVP